MSYFSQTQTLSSTIFAIVAGVLMRYLKGYKVGSNTLLLRPRLMRCIACFDQRSLDPSTVRFLCASETLG